MTLRWSGVMARRLAVVVLVAAVAACAQRTEPEADARRTELDAKADAALARLYAENPGAETLGSGASGILIFPNIIKAGLGVGAETGDGVLRVGDEAVGYYNTSAVSVGLQAGGQSYSQVLMFLDDAALQKFRNSAGFEVGVDGSIAVLSIGETGRIDTTNIKAPIVAFNFGESGLMAAANIEGSKYTKKDL